MRLYTRLKEILSEPVYEVAIILFLFEAVFVSRVSHLDDTWAFATWCEYIREHGIGNIYKCTVPIYNYPPLLSYPLFVFGALQGSAENIIRYFYFFKIGSLLADFIIAIALINLLGDKKRNVLWLLLLVANPVFIYDSYCWGQVDSILSLFVFAAFLCLLKEKVVAGVFFFTLALNFKVHAIIFLPPILLLACLQLANRITLKTIFLSVLTFAITQLCILAPFLMNGEGKDVWKTIINSVGYYQCITCNAYNAWFFLVGKDSVWSSDTGTWLNITYRNWGLLMFFVFSGVTLFPLFLSVISKMFKRNIYSIDRNSLFIVFALIPLLFLYFNTQMHERFGHTTLLFTSAIAFSIRRYWLFILVCAAYFGNMEGILHFFNFPNYGVLIFNPYWVATLYLVLIISLFYFLYQPFILQLKTNRNGQIAQTS